MWDVFFFQAEDGIRDAQESRGLGDVYKRQDVDKKIGTLSGGEKSRVMLACMLAVPVNFLVLDLSLIHI